MPILRGKSGCRITNEFSMRRGARCAPGKARTSHQRGIQIERVFETFTYRSSNRFYLEFIVIIPFARHFLNSKNTWIWKSKLTK
jgi:hypothetical protein